jgi:hypothetical protein
MEMFPTTPECRNLWRIWRDQPDGLRAALQLRSEPRVANKAAQAEWHLLTALATSGPERTRELIRARAAAFGSEHWRADLACLLILAGDALDDEDQMGFQVWAGRALSAWQAAQEAAAETKPETKPEIKPGITSLTRDEMVLGGLALTYYSISARVLEHPLIDPSELERAALAAAEALRVETAYLGVRFGPEIAVSLLQRARSLCTC